ncbi:MAG: paraquat-inducible protein A, partial [Myxococcota bacterium]
QDPQDLQACIACDLLLEKVPLKRGELARCPRCGHILNTAKIAARDRALAVAVSGWVLTIAASFLPVLGMEKAGFALQVSAVDTASALASSGVWPLSILALLLVVVIPLARFSALVAVLIRLSSPAPWMGPVFRWALALRPWAMAEVFLVGIVVSLLKLGDLVTVNIGLSFWALIGLLVVLVLEHQVLCPESIWSRLEPERAQ